ncbi:MAG: beta-ketoacyl-[acyl-carrier-protein] synthase family protein, partial [Deltaproteobacteria bacterium]|nr:beta-ketoacyl-[acyl-carrier-protein] synthase family protein [Deltaproteobacteria bacterium]
MARRVVITSASVISSLGASPPEIIAHLRQDRTAFARSPVDEDIVVCPVREFDIRDYTGPCKERRYLNRGAQFSVAAALRVVKDAGIAPDSLQKAGLFVGAGPNLDIGGEFPDIRGGAMDRRDLMALWILRFLPNTAAAVTADLLGIRGENLTVGGACAASLQAMGEAFRKIKDGYLDVALTGGGDSRLHPGGILAYKKAQALSRRAGAPDSASRPFDEERAGFVPGEGGAFFLLEELEHARRRGGRILGEICGFGSTFGGGGMTAPDPEGKHEAEAVRKAMAEASLDPFQIDVVSAHGTGTQLNDRMEAALIARIFGSGNKPFVIALKSWIGHLAAACGAVELAIALACLADNYLPPIRNLHKPCRP